VADDIDGAWFRNLMITAVSDDAGSPPVDVKAVLSKGRWRRRRHRAAVMLAVACAVVAVVIATWAGRQLAMAPSQVPASPPTSTSTLVVYRPPPWEVTRSGVPKYDMVAARLTDAAHQIPVLSHGATLTRSPWAPGLPPLTFEIIGGAYEARASIKTDRGQGWIDIRLFDADKDSMKGMCGEPYVEPGPGCSEKLLPDGSTVLTGENFVTDVTRGVHGWSAVVNKPDGTRIFVTVSNAYDGQSPAEGAQAPLTVEQLIEIATAPGLTAVAP
jgi:hypothetical protein